MTGPGQKKKKKTLHAVEINSSSSRKLGMFNEPHLTYLKKLLGYRLLTDQVITGVIAPIRKKKRRGLISQQSVKNLGEF